MVFFIMPNVTYITFKKLPNYWYTFTNNTTTTTSINNNDNLTRNSTINFPSNVILLIEEQNENVQKLFNGNKYAMALLISALLILLFGCCCVCNWFNQNSKIRTIIPRNKNILLGHGNILNGRQRRRRRSSRNSSCTGANQTSYNDVVTVAECNSNNNNNNRRAQQILRRNAVVVDNVDDNSDVERGNEDRTNPSADQPDVLRRYDLDVESLPSYTLCSGLPSYDAALEEFRKAGILLTTTPSVVKIFENTSKEHLINGNIFDNHEPSAASSSSNYTPNTFDNIDSNSNSCKCGGSLTNLRDGVFETSPAKQSTSIESIIELSPEHLNMLSEKRLSLQIAFNSSVRRIQPSNRGIDLRREVLRSHEIPAAIHRSSSLRAIPKHLINNESQDDNRNPTKILQFNMNRHRGSIV